MPAYEKVEELMGSSIVGSVIAVEGSVARMHLIGDELSAIAFNEISKDESGCANKHGCEAGPYPAISRSGWV